MATARMIMNTRVVKIAPDTLVNEAIETMNNNRINALIVEKANPTDTYGLVTMGDIIYKVVAPGRSPHEVKVNDIMTKPLIYLLPGTKIKHIARLFANNDISRAPVVENEEIIGFVSFHEIIADTALLEI